MKEEVFAERMDMAMDRRGISNGALARKTGISARSIRQYRKGVYLPGAYNLRLIAKGLNASADWLLGITDLGGKT